METEFSNSAGELFRPQPFIYRERDGDEVLEILDCSIRNGVPVLLDGKGNPLSVGSSPVYLPFKVN